MYIITTSNTFLPMTSPITDYTIRRDLVLIDALSHTIDLPIAYDSFFNTDESTYYDLISLTDDKPFTFNPYSYSNETIEAIQLNLIHDISSYYPQYKRFLNPSLFTL